MAIAIKIEMKLGKQTKNKLVYEASNSAVPSVYIEKTALPHAPATLILTLTEPE